MSLAILKSRALAGMHAPQVTVEVHLANGLPAFTIVGLPETEVKESKDRVRAAIVNARFEFPSKRITVNLAPADLPKESGRFDLPIALGILAASGQIPSERLDEYEYAGELSLSGDLRPVRGALAMTFAMSRTRRAGDGSKAAAGSYGRDPHGIEGNEGGRSNGSREVAEDREGRHARASRGFILPASSAAEAALVTDADIRPARSLLEVCAHLCGTEGLPRVVASAPATDPIHADFAEVKGQAAAKRALEVAAAGGHSVLMIGSPGTGKSMLAQRFAGLLPPMSEDEALESASLLSLTGAFRPELWRRRVFRAPHHTASAVALVGGGGVPRPGEISLAHHGVLFLDELPEFERRVLEVLREPLESGRITISRAARQADFPARFQLVAAMNPCPCGWLGHKVRACRCSPDQIARYQDRISGPLLDRIDMHIEVPALSQEDIAASSAGEPSAAIAQRVLRTRERQMARQDTVNAFLTNTGIETHCTPNEAGARLLKTAMTRLGWSARAYHRVLKVARTIADLDGADAVSAAHVAEAIGYRRGLMRAE